MHPEWYTDEFHLICDRAGVRRIQLHESRHTACSLMEKAGVPVSVIAAWADHYSGAFTMSQYVHANPEDLAAGPRRAVGNLPSGGLAVSSLPYDLGEGQLATLIVATPDGAVQVDVAMSLRPLAEEDPRRPGDVIWHDADAGRDTFITRLEAVADALRGAS